MIGLISGVVAAIAACYGNWKLFAASSVILFISEMQELIDAVNKK